MRQFPKIEDLKPGDRLVADDAFTCLDLDQVVEVAADEAGELYVPCREGKHYLEGQRGYRDDDEDQCVGLSRPA